MQRRSKVVELIRIHRHLAWSSILDTGNRFLHFGFDPPKGYRWLEDRGLVGFEAFTCLQPWYYLDSVGAFSVNDVWANGSATSRLVAFARRQDSDEIACFEIANGEAGAVVVIHGWTPGGYDIIGRHEDFWDWLHQVINDMRDFVDPDDE